MSTRMERAKIARYMRWGVASCGGTGRGNLRKTDRKIAANGMHRVRFVGWGLKRVQTSFVLSSRVEEAKKTIHSRETPVRRDTSMPYQLVVMGQKSCVPPVR